MKTQVIMESPDRELFGVKIRQQSKTGFLNLSDLQQMYNIAAEKHGWARSRTVAEILSYTQNAERIYYLLENQGVIKAGFPAFMEEVGKNGIANTLKRYGAYQTTGARHTKTTWCNPYIWVLVAMEMNPMLYAQTVVWLTDGLLINRIEAGNFYRSLSAQLARLPQADYVRIARALNFIVFGRHETGIRQMATKDQLKELAVLEEKMAFAMEMGYISSQEHLLAELRRMWTMKYNRKFLE